MQHVIPVLRQTLIEVLIYLVNVFDRNQSDNSMSELFLLTAIFDNHLFPRNRKSKIERMSTPQNYEYIFSVFFFQIESFITEWFAKTNETRFSYYTLLHFIVHKFFVFCFVLRPSTLYYTLAVILCFAGFCKRLYVHLK